MVFTIETASAEETEKLAAKLGARLRGGEVIEMISDLGGGKTTFVRGLARGFGSSDRVSSPTFTVEKVYEAGDKKIYHFDFYRLNDPGVIAHELEGRIDDDKAVTVIEWAEGVSSVLPGERLTVKLTRTGDDSRRIEIDYPKSLAYLVEDL